MNKIWTLLKVDFLNNQKFFNMEFRGKDRTKNILLIVLLLFLLGPLYIGFLTNLWTIFDMFLELGQTRLFLQMGVATSQLMILLFSAPKILNSFYYDSDVEVLVPLPLNNYDILGSKFISILIREYSKVFLIYLPFIFIFGYKTGLGILYWIYGLVSMIILPILPLVLVSIIIILLMKFTNIGKKKDLIRGIGMVLLVGMMIFMQMGISKISGNGGSITERDIMKIISNYMDTLSSSFDLFFPMAFLFSNGLIGFSNISGFLNMIASLGINIGLLLSMLYVGEKLYMDGFLKGSLFKETKKSKKSKKLNYKESRPYLAIAKKEFIMIVKIPIYFFNSIMGSLMMPIMFLIPFLMDRDNNQIKELLANTDPIIPTMVFVGIGILLNLTGPAATSFSREGKSFWIQKHLPIKGEDQAKARILVSLILQLLTCIIFGIIGRLMFGFNILDMLLMTIYILVLSLPVICISLIIDIKKPKLNWTSPEEAMKQNMNVVKTMIVNFIYLIILAVVGVFLYKLGDMYVYVFIGLLGIVLSKIFYSKLIKAIDVEMLR